jgi:hypothetical protein
MYFDKNLSKHFGSVASIILGLIIFATGVFWLYMVIVSIRSGEIWRISKYDPGFVTRENDADQFWSLEAGYAAVGLAVISLSIWILANTYRKLRGLR